MHRITLQGRPHIDRPAVHASRLWPKSTWPTHCSVGYYDDRPLVLNARSIRNPQNCVPTQLPRCPQVVSCHELSPTCAAILDPTIPSPRNTPARTILLRITNQPLPAVFSLCLGLQLQRRHSTCSHPSSFTFLPFLTFFASDQFAGQHFFSGIPASESSSLRVCQS